MAPIDQWLAGSWLRYKRKLWELLLIGGMGSAAGFAASLLPLFLVGLLALLRGRSAWWGWAAALAASLSAGLWAVSWAQTAMTEAALESEPVSVSDAYRRTWGKVGRFSWVCLLWVLVLVGGFFVFAVPALVLGVALAFAPFLCVAEGLGGMAALEASFACVEGCWWAVSGRLALVAAAVAAVSAIPIAGPILGALAAPFALVATAAMYEELRAAKTAPLGSRAAKAWLAVAGLGLLAPVWLAARLATALENGAAAQAAAIVRSTIDNPIDPAAGRRMIELLQNGATPQNVSEVVELMAAARWPVRDVSISTAAAAGAPRPDPAR